MLPRDWDIIIRRTMENKKIIGGGFSLNFNIDSLYLNFMLKMIFILVHFTKAPSDDRSIFIRSQPLKKDLSILDIPVMEDIELSYWMKKHGKVILLRESVVTSTEIFVQNGFLRQIWKIEYEEDGYRFFLFRGGPVSTSETIDAWQTTLSEKQEYLYNSLNECTFTIEAYSS